VNTKFFSPRTGAIAGIIGVFEFSVMWISAAIADGHWVLGEMTLSELGGKGRAGAVLFNTGVIVEAILALVFAFGLYKALGKTALSRVAAIGLFAACLALLGVGLFPISTGTPHTMASYAFFGLVVIAIALLIVPIWRSHVFHSSGGIITLLTLLVPLLLAPFINLPTLEMLTVIILMAWCLFISVRMLFHHPAVK
jgi:hypothetical membrane protein